MSDGSFWPFVITWPNATIEAAESATKNVSGTLQNATQQHKQFGQHLPNLSIGRGLHSIKCRSPVTTAVSF